MSILSSVILFSLLSGITVFLGGLFALFLKKVLKRFFKRGDYPFFYSFWYRYYA